MFRDGSLVGEEEVMDGGKGTGAVVTCLVLFLGRYRDAQHQEKPPRRIDFSNENMIFECIIHGSEACVLGQR